MRTWGVRLGTDCGVALAPPLMMGLALLLSFTSVSAMGSRISGDVSDSVRARHLAEAGIEVGFTVLINTPDFSAALAGASASAPWVPVVTNAALSGVTTGGSTAGAGFAGIYTVVVRNDYQNADAALTGQSSGTDTIPNETLTRDGNRIVIMRAIGTVNGATKTIEVVVRRQQQPLPFPDVVNLPGLQTDAFIILDIDQHDAVQTRDVNLESGRIHVSGDFDAPAAD